jgi:aldehyde dehydrogenase (NAD+)
MTHTHEFFIDGAWVRASGRSFTTVINPSDESVIAEVALASAADVARAVDAAVGAFERYGRSSLAERIALLERLLETYRARAADIAGMLVQEVGIPKQLAAGQVKVGEAHITIMFEVLRHFAFVESRRSFDVVKEPVGVCALITPWNAPVSQVLCKLVPALAAGCTTVVKPSEVTPLCTLILAEIVEAIGAPAGVINLINGDGPEAGAALAAHPGVDMVSFTGSVRGGVAVALAAAPTVKRVVQELGGKSANIILRDAQLEPAVRKGVAGCFFNSGQACAAPSRMLVPRESLARAAQIAAEAAARLKVGVPTAPDSELGPLVNRAQFERVQAFIRSGIDDGAVLVAGGPERPAGLPRGYFVQPTVFSEVDPAMTIAREEIFGPVLCILGYDTEADAVRIANGTPYGLAGYVASGSDVHAREIAAQLRVGYVSINYPPWNPVAPFGGYKRSGNGRQYAEHGLAECLEIKSIVTGQAAG